jgi:hypothetical protein
MERKAVVVDEERLFDFVAKRGCPPGRAAKNIECQRHKTCEDCVLDYLRADPEPTEPTELKPGDPVTAETVQVEDVVNLPNHRLGPRKGTFVGFYSGKPHCDSVLRVGDALFGAHGADWQDATLVSRPDPFTLLHFGSKVYDEVEQRERTITALDDEADGKRLRLDHAAWGVWNPDRFRVID